MEQTADMALVSGIEEAKILEVKKEEIHQKAVCRNIVYCRETVKIGIHKKG